MLGAEELFRALDREGFDLVERTRSAYRAARDTALRTFVDQIETLAIERAKKLFGAEHANVQPHSGSQANFPLHRRAAARRQDPRDEPPRTAATSPTATPANFSASSTRRRLWRAPGQQPDRLRRTRRGRRARKAEDDHRRRQRLLPGHRLARWARSPRPTASYSSPTSRTSPGLSSPPHPRPCPTRTSSPPRRTRRSAAPAAA